MKKNRILTAALAGALSLSLAIPALGAKWEVVNNPSEVTDPTEVTEAEKNAYGHTTISVITAPVKEVKNVSFQVPLYVTIAVTNGSKSILAPTPDECAIHNTAEVGTGTSFAVTGLSLKVLKGSKYKIVNPWDADAATYYSNPGAAAKIDCEPKDPYHMTLVVGNCFMPNTTAWTEGEERAVNLIQDATYRRIGNSFYQQNGQRHVDNTIAPGGNLRIQILGTVNSTANRAEEAAAPHFQVKYTVTPLDAQGNPITSGQGAFKYAGDSSLKAGLGEDYSVTTPLQPAEDAQV